MPHITFIHGILNKPPADELLEIWQRALGEGGGIDLENEGISSSMIYWADVLYASPVEEDLESALESAPSGLPAAPGDTTVEPTHAGEREWVQRMEQRLGLAREVADEAFESPRDAQGWDAATEGEPGSGDEVLEGIPLPWTWKKELMRVLLRDAHHYLFNTEYSPRPGVSYHVRDEIRRRVVEDLTANAPADGKHLLVSHSMGTVIAYDCLKRFAATPSVKGLMTIGSPLGLDEVQEPLKPEYTRWDGFPSGRLEGGWANVFDRWDAVAAFDPFLGNDYQRHGDDVVRDRSQSNGGRWRHDIRKYLSRSTLRDSLLDLLAEALSIRA